MNDTMSDAERTWLNATVGPPVPPLIDRTMTALQAIEALGGYMQPQRSDEADPFDLAGWRINTDEWTRVPYAHPFGALYDRMISCDD